jgi:hypothetical protein
MRIIVAKARHRCVAF